MKQKGRTPGEESLQRGNTEEEPMQQEPTSEARLRKGLELDKKENASEKNSTTSSSRSGSRRKTSAAASKRSTARSLDDSTDGSNDTGAADTATTTATAARKGITTSGATTTTRKRTASTTSRSGVRSRRQATGAVAQVARAIPTSSVIKRKSRVYELRGHWGKQDDKGTRWLKKVPEDTAPKRLSEIPLVAGHNEVEFTYWEAFNRQTSGFMLYTQDGYRYWADAGAVRWLNAAEREGYTPENSIFVVRRVMTHNDGITLSYGFRKVAEEDPIEDDSDEEMPAASDAMDVDEDDRPAYLRTPHLSDEENRNEYD